MRKAFSPQLRLDSREVTEVELNLDCRDEIIPILRSLQHIYSRPEVRDQIFDLICQDVNKDTRGDCGREGLDYWQILVLAAVRLGCNLNYDKLQDLAEQHRALRQVMGIGDWDARISFNWRRIRDNLCQLRPTTIERISHTIVAEGHRLAPDAPQKVRVDSFVVETNIHWPSESTLIRDGVRKIIELCVILCSSLKLSGWRQHKHLLQKINRRSRNIERISAKKSPQYQQRLKDEYEKLLKHSGRITRRARTTLEEAEARLGDAPSLQELRIFLQRTEQVRGTARRRVLHGEKVPNEEKLFSIFEPHTQLYKRGKAGEPVQFGRLVLVYEDAAGFLVHQHVLPRQAHDRDVVVEQTRTIQERLAGQIKEASFDRGFHTPENQAQLARIIAHPCLPKPGTQQAARQQAAATVHFRQARRRHAGIESAISALQAGNGLERCRDRSELGFERYVALGILGRNLHVLGKLLIARDHADSAAAFSQRQRPAA